MAEARGATILAEILGGASTADAHHITAPSPGGTRRARRAWRSRSPTPGIAAADIVHVNAHGTSTPLNDAAEAEAMAKVFGTPGPAGHVDQGRHRPRLGAAGAIEAVAVVESMRRKLIPPTAVTTEVDPELPPIDLVIGEARDVGAGPDASATASASAATTAPWCSAPRDPVCTNRMPVASVVRTASARQLELEELALTGRPPP